MQSNADPGSPRATAAAAGAPPPAALTAVVPAPMPRALHDGPFQAVCRAWAGGGAAPTADDPPLLAALERLATVARRTGVPIVDVLCALNSIGRSVGGRDFHAVRAWAGRVVIVAYYRGA